LAEWIYEEGIGENRAALVEGGTILEAAIELPGLIRLGAVRPAQLRQIFAGGRRGLVLLDGRREAIIEPVPAGLNEGAAFRAAVIREAIPEAGRPKFPKVVASEEAVGEGPSLKDRIGRHVRLSPIGPDRLEEAGWSELLEEARTGEIGFSGGSLRMSLTPAMTLFDVDGDLSPSKLAEAGAAAAARTIRRLGISGSIGLDLPTLPDRASRQAAAAAVDAILPQPFERTAVNGFGFLQIVRRRQRPSIPEQLRDDPLAAAARALLRQAERCSGHGRLSIQAAPALIEQLQSKPDWLDRLRQNIGAEVTLQPQRELSISAGNVQRESL
jgi:ribonuclease G